MKARDVNSIVDRYGAHPWALISILQEVQEKKGFLSSDVLKQVSERMNIRMSQLYGVATFFKSFNMAPQGRHTVTLCLGTACHVRGGTKILDEIAGFLKIKPGEATKDGFYSLKAVNCLGACAIGPVMVIDGKYYSHMSASKAKKILSEYRGKK